VPRNSDQFAQKVPQLEEFCRDDQDFQQRWIPRYWPGKSVFAGPDGQAGRVRYTGPTCFKNVCPVFSEAGALE